MASPRFRHAPSLPELPKGAERAIIAQFKAVQNDLDAIRGVQANSPPVLAGRAYAAHEGELVRIAPSAAGQLITIPPGRAENISQKIRIAVVGGILSPGATVAIVGGQGTINGAATLTLAAIGLYELSSVGAPGWVVTPVSAAGSALPPDADYGDITVSGVGTVWNIDPGVVGNVELATMPANTVKANATAGVAAPTDFGIAVNNFLLRLAGNIISGSGTQATTLLDVFTSVLKGLVPASGGGTVNFLRADGTFAAPGGGGALTLLTTEVNLGSVPTRSGSFTIAGAGMTVGRPVLIQQAVGPYTGKGTLADEAEDQVTVSASVTSATVITAYWSATHSPIVGNVRFNYAVSA